jgi:hypothetical protein
MSGSDKTPDLRDVVRHLLAIRMLLAIQNGLMLGALIGWLTR